MKAVLVIEDEAQTRTMFLRCLELEGYRAFGASSGTAGMELARRHNPDLVVCDIMMPDMDGYSVLSALRRAQETALIPLIFLTAKVTMADLRQGMDLGADDYLTKPCTVEQFLAAIATRLRRQDELAQGRKQRLTDRDQRSQLTQADPDRETELASIFPSHTKLAAVFDFIEAHYNQAINLNDVAQAAGYSSAYLTSLVQAETGRTVGQWITARRMAQARQLLGHTQTSIGRIAAAIGYADAGYFSRKFRQNHGVSPQKWRQEFVSNLTKQPL